MISLDQVLLLEQKVESAVEKIKQLEGENAALRNKCSELTNALSAKTEQLTSLEDEQKTIESGIIKAIDRLNSIENSVLKTAGQSEPVQTQAKPATAGLAAAAAKVVEEEVEEVPAEEPVEEPVEEPIQEQIEEPEEESFEDSPAADMSFDQMMLVEEEIEDDAEDAESDPESKDQLGFDIF